jgi:hypothetical protein
MLSKGDIHMGATSVTGIGHGSVEGMDSGRKEYTVAASRLIGPRIVACDQVALVGGTLTINLPFLPTTPNEFLKTVPESPTYPAGSYQPATYAVIATDNTAAAAVKAVLTAATDTAGNAYTQLVLTGTGTDLISYMVVKQGLMP